MGRWKRFACKLAVTVTTNFENKEITVGLFASFDLKNILLVSRARYRHNNWP